MTPADIIRLAELADYPLLEFDGKKHVHAALLRMFKLAVAEEREAICPLVYGLCGSDNDAERIVRAIRARGRNET